MGIPTIIATWGGAGANCYTEVTTADAYMDTKVDRSAWDAAQGPKRQAALIEATRHIDARNWRGDKYYWDQRLEFPRTYNHAQGLGTRFDSATPIGTPFDVEYTWMQRRVTEATCEQALWVLGLGGDDPFRKLQRRGVRSYSESIGKISESYSFVGIAGQLSPEASQLLGEYFDSPRIVRG